MIVNHGSSTHRGARGPVSGACGLGDRAAASRSTAVTHATSHAATGGATRSADSRATTDHVAGRRTCHVVACTGQPGGFLARRRHGASTEQLDTCDDASAPLGPTTRGVMATFEWMTRDGITA